MTSEQTRENLPDNRSAHRDLEREQPSRLVGYLGVDVLNNATVCNEALGLLARGLPLQPVSVDRHPKPLFHKSETLRELVTRLETLRPIRPVEAVGLVLLAPFEHRARFLKLLVRIAVQPVESPSERLRLLAHLLPALKLARLWKSKPIGHVHAHWAHTATTVAMHAAALLDVGFSFTGHANDLFVHRVALPAKARAARFAVAISWFHRNLLVREGAPPDRVPVVYCGIPAKPYEALPEPPPTRAEPLVLAVGRLVEKKGFDRLLQALALLRARNVPFRAQILGSGPLLEQLRRLARSLELEDRVEIPGNTVLQEELPDRLRHADLVALPCVRDSDGDMDGLPQVLIEAMLAGRPVVSTRLVGIPDLVRHERTGLLVPPADVDALADALEQLILRPEQRQRLARQARAWALEHFTLDAAVDRLAPLFQWAAENPGQSPPPPELLHPPAPEARAQYPDPRHANAPPEPLPLQLPAEPNPCQNLP